MMRTFRRRFELCLVGIAAGLAFALSAEPHCVPGLIFAAPGLWAFALGDSRSPLSPRAAFFLGGISGLTMQLMAFAWIPGLLERFARFPAPAAWATAALLYVAQALPYALALGTAAAIRGPRAPLYVGLPVALTAIAGRLPTLFPWRPADVLTSSALPFAQLAELGGAPLVDLAFAWVGVGLVEGARTRARAPIVVAIVALLGGTSFGVLRIAQLERDRESLPSARIGVVQPNVSIEDKHDPSRAIENLASLHGGTFRALEDGAELVIWPESAHPFPLRRGHFQDWRGATAIRPRDLGVPIVTGVITQEDRCMRWNSVVAVDPSGAISGVADKITLLPFGEFAPLHRFYPAWLKELAPCAGFHPGEHEPLLVAAGVELGILNCYEDLLPVRSRALANEGARVLVNLTNDAWFGDTAEPHLHHMVSRLRTIETRRDLLRAVNTGVSAHVSSTGRDTIRTETFVATEFVADARLSDAVTVYMRLGDVLTPALLAWLFALVFIRRRERQVPMSSSRSHAGR
jgi:apolipoprotein N-acyltransferase